MPIMPAILLRIPAQNSAIGNFLWAFLLVPKDKGVGQGNCVLLSTTFQLGIQQIGKWFCSVK